MATSKYNMLAIKVLMFIYKVPETGSAVAQEGMYFQKQFDDRYG